MGGSSAPGLSILTALNFMRNGRGLLQEGYDKVRLTCAHIIPGEFKQLGRTQYHGSVFKVALLQHWMVVVSGPKMVEDLRRRPDDELSFTEGTEEVRGMAILREPYDLWTDPFIHFRLCRSGISSSLRCQISHTTSILSRRNFRARSRLSFPM